jgi:hypothetical protein
VRKREKGTSSMLSNGWLAADAIRQGARANTLRAMCVGNTLALYVNDALVVQVTDDTFDSGDVGLAGGTFSAANIRIEFDDLIVFQP